MTEPLGLPPGLTASPDRRAVPPHRTAVAGRGGGGTLRAPRQVSHHRKGHRWCRRAGAGCAGGDGEPSRPAGSNTRTIAAARNRAGLPDSVARPLPGPMRRGATGIRTVQAGSLPAPGGKHRGAALTCDPGPRVAGPGGHPALTSPMRRPPTRPIRCWPGCSSGPRRTLIACPTVPDTGSTSRFGRQ